MSFSIPIRPLSLLLSALSAGLMAALFPPLNLPFFAPVALAPLLWSVAHEPSPAWRLLSGWLAGFIYWISICHWIGAVLAAYGGLSTPLSLLALVLFAAVKAAHWAFFSWAAGRMIHRWWAIPAIAALWAGLERTQGPLGFAWLMLGNAGISMSLPLRLAPVAGVYGISFLMAAISVAVTLVLLRRPRHELIWLAPFAGLALLPAAQVPQAPVQQAVSLQTRVPAEFSWSADEKDRAARQFSLLTLQNALDPSKPKPALLLWPEAPAPFYYYEDESFRRQMTETARLASAPLLFGTVAYTGDKRPLNSAVLLGERGQLLGRYDKNFLVPFGEFIPPGFGWIEQVSNEAGAYAPGNETKVFTVRDPSGRDRSIGPFICYESAFPHLVRRFAAGGAEVLINLTNDGYFGRSPAREQHLLLARMRAVENRRWLLRSANDGVTASIDPAGVIRDRIPEFTRQTARLRFAWLREQTLYTRYGDWFAWSALALGLLLTLLPAPRKM